MKIRIFIVLLTLSILSSLFGEEHKNALGQFLNQKRMQHGSFLSVRELDLSPYSEQLNDVNLGLILGKFSNLEKLSLNGAKKLSPWSGKSLADKGERLKYLDISNCFKFNQEGFDSIFKRCHNLRILKIAGCVEFCDDNLFTLADNCNLIEDLDLSGCGENITDLGIIEISTKLQSLKNINLSNLSKITELGVKTLVQNCPVLRFINLTGCDLVNLSQENLISQLHSINSKLLIKIEDKFYIKI